MAGIMSPAPSELTRQAERLTWLYVLALSAVACLSILGQLLVQWSLDRQRSDSTVVNLAGRQRMLSQRLTKAALAADRVGSPEQLAAHRQEMAEVLAQWRQADAGLRRGDERLGLPGGNSHEVEQALAQLEPHLRAMAQATEALLGAEGDRQDALQRLLAHEPQFLAAMDAIVNQYEREARQRVAWLQSIERGLLLLTLAILAGEGILIFRPAVRRLRLAAGSLEESRRQLEVAKERAESASDAKSRFLATISHELRNPLQAILASLELLAPTAADAQQREHLATISSSARALLVLLNDLLDLARIEAGQLAIVQAPLDPIGLTQRTLAMVRPQALAQGLLLESDLPENPPAGLSGDEIRLQQVLLNLLTNALKFTPEGAIQVRLRQVPTGDDSERLRWEISDTGIGIAADQQQRIFDSFTQVSEPAQRKGGAGLGLAICKRLVGLMSGQIGVQSQPGAGSTFWFEVSLEKCLSLESAAPVANPPQHPEGPLRVLVVDDDPVNRKLLAQLVELLGHEVVVASGGEGALARFQETGFDAAILDWQLPDMNGGELAGQIRTAERALQRRPMPLVALSAAMERSSQDKAPFDHWLAKPVGLAELSKALGAPESLSVARQVDAARWTAALARLGGRRDFLANLARAYCRGLPALLEELRAAAAAENRPAEVARLAHLLAGQGSNFDAPALAAAARSVEDRAEANVLSPQLVSQLETHCQRLADELEHWLAEPSASV